MPDFFNNVKRAFRNLGVDLAVSRRAIDYFARDSTTGHRGIMYHAEPIEMIVLPRTATKLLNLVGGSYVKYDHVGYTDEDINVGSQIRDLDDVFYEVSSVEPQKIGNTLYMNVCGLTRLPLQKYTFEVVLEPSGESNVRTLFRIDDDTALAGTEEGAEIWRTTDAGDNWTKVADLAATADDIRSFVQTAVSEKIVAGSTANPATSAVNFYKSTDNGVTWSIADTITPGGFQPGRIFDIIKLDNDDLLAGCRNGKIYRSQDDGDNWSQLAQLADGDFVNSMLNLGGTDVLCCTGKYKQGDAAVNVPKVYKSADSGVNWAEKLDMSAEEDVAICLFQADSGRCFVGAYDSGGIWKSDDDGDNWTKAYDVGANRMAARITSITVGGSEILLATVGHATGTVDYCSIWRSTDDGVNWYEWSLLREDTLAQGGSMWILELNATEHTLLASSGNHSCQGRIWRCKYG